VALLGMAFKANIDDLRESPALQIAQRLAERASSAEILAVEPHVEQLPASLQGLSNVSLTALDEALERADVIVLLVDHDVFKEVPASQRSSATVIDTRGIWR